MARNTLPASKIKDLIYSMKKSKDKSFKFYSKDLGTFITPTFNKFYDLLTNTLALDLSNTSLTWDNDYMIVEYKEEGMLNVSIVDYNFFQELIKLNKIQEFQT